MAEYKVVVDVQGNFHRGLMWGLAAGFVVGAGFTLAVLVVLHLWGPVPVQLPY